MDLKAFLKYAEGLDNIIIDEFHRAGGLLFDHAQAHTLRRQEIYSKLLGLFPEYQISLLSPVDIMRSAGDGWDFEGLLFGRSPPR